MVTERNYPVWWLNMFRERIATEKAQVPTWGLTLVTNNKWKPDERSYLALDDKESMENRYEGCREERVDIVTE